MGGHAFKDLYCPRISSEVYNSIKAKTTATLQMVFAKVVVPTEMPGKSDYGDIDFLVSGPNQTLSNSTIETFDWEGTVAIVKAVLETSHGRRGFLNPDCMYFAVPFSDVEEEYWIQVDVKVCFRKELFEWETFRLNYASNSKIVGSMIKPLGLTIDPEGLHIRMEEMEETNFPGSMIYISHDPKDVLRIAGLDRRILNAGFETKDGIYEYFADSWLFNPMHFVARIAEEKYLERLEGRSPHWMYFIKEWIPKKLLEHDLDNGEILDKQKVGLEIWYMRTRAAVRDKVFTMFPRIAAEYYTKRAAHLSDTEERKLRRMILEAIPIGDTGWKNDFPQPQIIIRLSEQQSLEQEHRANIDESIKSLKPADTMVQTCESDDSLSRSCLASNPTSAVIPEGYVSGDIPLYLDPLPRPPPQSCIPHPPPVGMSPEAKLLCLERWTLFDPSTGKPYLLAGPREKALNMQWTDAVYAGATHDVFTKWAKEMWWPIWIRQSYVNYVGMWRKRFEKEDKKAEKVKLKTEEAIKARKDTISGRLQILNSRSRLLNGGAAVAESHLE